MAKVAVIIAHTVQGWQPLALGEDITGLLKAFKEIKVAGKLELYGEPVDTVLLFDTSGRIQKKKLKTPEAKALVDGLNHRTDEDANKVEEVFTEANENAR